MLVVLLIYFYPILKASKLYDSSANITIRNGIRYCILIYVICSIIHCHQYLILLFNSLSSGSWMLLKADAYNGDLGLTSSSFIQRVSTVFVQTFMPAMMVYAFHSLTDTSKAFKYSLVLILFAIIPDLVISLLYVYRGGIFTISLLSLVCYMMFYKNISIIKRRKMNICILTASAIVLLLMLAISVSRFGEDDYSSSLVSYLGQPMLVYNAGIFNSIENYAKGNYFFQNFTGLSRDDIWVDSRYGILTNDGGALNTFIGCSILDFGFILTILISVLVAVVMKNVLNRNRFDFADAYMFLFYVNYLLLGVFHSTMGYCKNIIYAVMLYTVLKCVNINIKMK